MIIIILLVYKHIQKDKTNATAQQIKATYREPGHLEQMSLRIFSPHHRSFEEIFFVCVDPSDTFVKPSLWLWVDPNIVCPGQLPHSGAADPQTDPQTDPTEFQEADLQRAPQQGDVLPPPPQPDSTHLLVQ